MIELRTLEDKLLASPTELMNSTEDDVRTHEYFINMGPQHPSTHGVLRLVLKMNGEMIQEVIPVLGYVHRSIEKMSEYLNGRQIVHLTDRMDYLGALCNNWAMSMAVEKAMNIELNDRIEVIRTLMAELNRVQSHLLWWGVLGMDLGAVTAFFYGFRDREKLTELLEKTTGARLTQNYIQPGGLMFDIHKDFVVDVKAFIKYMRPLIDEYETLLGGNIIFQERMRGVGHLTAEEALSYSATGPTLRGSGVPYDLRKIEPYGAYSQVDFRVPVGSTGDCWDRYWIRIEEIRQSLNIIEQLIDNIPEGKFSVIKPAAKLKLPKGSTYSQLETPRGVLGVYLEGNGTEIPVRTHFRSPSFNNLWTVVKMGPTGKLADLVAMVSSLDLVIPDIDR